MTIRGNKHSGHIALALSRCDHDEAAVSESHIIEDQSTLGKPREVQVIALGEVNSVLWNPTTTNSPLPSVAPSNGSTVGNG